MFTISDNFVNTLIIGYCQWIHTIEEPTPLMTGTLSTIIVLEAREITRLARLKSKYIHFESFNDSPN